MNLHSTLGSFPKHSQKVLPDLLVQSMRQRASRAYNLYSDNQKIYSRLTNTKSTIPSVETFMKAGEHHDKLLRSMSTFKVKKSSRGEATPMINKKAIPIYTSEMERRNQRRKTRTTKL